jgi:hypothetical protein
MNSIEIYKFLYHISIVIWVFPAIRQFRKDVFLYFLILAIGDPIAMVFQTLFKINLPSQVFVVTSYAMLTGVLYKRSSKKLKMALILFGVVLSVLMIFLFIPPTYCLMTLIMIHCILSVLFVKTFIIDYSTNSRINYFYLALIFYTLTVITKFLVVIIGLNDATAFFILTSIAQIFFGLYFSIVGEHKQKPVVKP